MLGPALAVALGVLAVAPPDGPGAAPSAADGPPLVSAPELPQKLPPPPPQCELDLHARLETCTERARAVPADAPAESPAVAEVRQCMAALSQDFRSLSLAEILRLDPTAPILRAESGSARALIDDAAIHEIDLEQALSAAARAPVAEFAARAQRVRSTASATLRSFQRANALVAGRSALVVRGGVSMGAYQAGYLYFQTEFLKRHSVALRGQQQGFSVVSGSSAGAINALIAGVSSCRALEDDFLDSLFFRVWVGVGFYIDEGWPSLLDDVDDPRAALSKAPLLEAQRLVEGAMRDPSGWTETIPHCEVAVGLTTTRTTPRDLAIGVDAASRAHHRIDLLSGLPDDGEPPALEGDAVAAHEPSPPELSAALQEERFGFRLEALGANDPARPLHIHNIRPRIQHAQAGFSAQTLALLRGELYPFVGEDPYDLVEIEDLLTLARASAAFPLAFAPESMDYGVVSVDGSTQQLTGVELIDGGVFDNHPFGFAASLREWTERPPAAYAGPSGLSSCDPSSPARSLLPHQPTEFLFVEPTLVAYDAGEPHDSKLELCGGAGNRECLLGTYGEFALAFLESSREASLLKDADDLPYLRMQQAGMSGDTIELPRRGLPITGEQLAHFLAFFETDFRVFDFVVGLVDAERHLGAHPVWSHSHQAFPPIAEPRVDCLRDYWAARDAGRLPADIPVVDGDVPALPDSCRALYRADSPELERADAGPDRLRGDAHNFAALLVASHAYMAWLASPAHTSTGEFDRFFAELDRAGFRFIDLQRLARKRVWALRGTVKIDAQRARKLVRDLSEQAIVRVADRQPSWRGRMLVELGGKAAANLAIDYRHPSKVVGLGFALNGAELHLGVSPNLFRLGPTTLRFDVGVRAHRLLRRAVVNPDPEFAALGPDQDSEFSEPWRMSFDAFHRWTLSGPGFLGAVAKERHGAVIQTELGLGFGVSEGVVFAKDPGDVHRALRFGPELAFGVSFFQRVLISTWMSVWVDGCAVRGPACAVGATYRDSNLDRETLAFGANLMWRWLPL